MRKLISTDGRTVRLFALWLPLIRVLVFNPLSGMLLANGEGYVAYYVVHDAGELLSVLSLFGMAGVALYGLFTRNGSLVGACFAWEGMSLLAIGLFLQTVLIWLFALLDAYLLPPFLLSNYTLGQLSEGILAEIAISSFINLIIVYAVFCLSVLAGKIVRDRRRRNSVTLLMLSSPDRDVNPAVGACGASAAVYLVLSFAGSFARMWSDVAEAGFPSSFSGYVLLLEPYILTVICTVLAFMLEIRLIRALAERDREA